MKPRPEQAVASFQPVGELLTMCQVQAGQAQLVYSRELGSKEARLSCWQRNKVPPSLLLSICEERIGVGPSGISQEGFLCMPSVP